MNGKKIWILKLFAGFLVLMLFCTIISRTASSVIVPKVTTGKIKEGRLTIRVEGTGTIGMKRTRMVSFPAGVRVQETKKKGEAVKKGDALLLCDLEYLEEQLAGKEAEIRKMELQLEGQRLSASPDAHVDASVGASQEWNRVFGEYQKAQEAFSSASENLKKGRQKLLEEYRKKKQNAKEQQEKALARAEQSYLKAKEQGRGEEEKETYRKEKAKIRATYKASVDQAEKEYEAELGKLEETAALAAETAKASKDAVEAAQDAVNLAGMQDASDAQNRAKAAELGGLEQQSTEIDLELLRRDKEKIGRLLEKGGVVEAAEDGVVEDNPLQPGMITSGQEVILLGFGGYQLNAVIGAEDFSKVTEGDSVKIMLPNSAQSIEALAGPCRMGEKDGSFTALLGQDDLACGWEVSWTVEKDTAKTYEKKIPVSALREDTKGAYCLVMEEERTVLGMEYTARRVNLTVVDKDASYAAVEGSLDRTDFIITGSSKNIAEGDRVRMAE